MGDAVQRGYRALRLAWMGPGKQLPASDTKRSRRLKAFLLRMLLPAPVLVESLP
jgi:hypothetical protein